MRRQREAFNAGPVDRLGRADFDAVSPRVGLLFEPAQGVQFYANYSRSVEFPGFIELAQLSAFVPLAAQRAWTAEVGTRGQAGMLNWDLSLYRADIRGELLQYNPGEADVPAATFNAGRTRHEGHEGALETHHTACVRLRRVYYAARALLGETGDG